MPTYVTLTDLKTFVGIPTADTGDDATLTRALDASEAQVNSFTGRTFGAPGGTTTRYYTAESSGLVRIDPIQNVTDLAVTTDETGDGTFETAWVLDTDYRLAPYNAALDGQPYTYMVVIGDNRFPTVARGVKVVARFGYTAVPASVAQAVLIQASRLWKRKDAPFGIAGTPEFGSELRLLSALDPDVQALLRPYRTMWVVSA